MNYEAFQKLVNISKEDIYRDTFEENRDRIRVKKETTVVKNLEKIFDATLGISNKKGFQAMTMRDLSAETGLSMGALYSYFSSKEELLENLQNQSRTMIKRIFERCIQEAQGAAAKLQVAIKAHLYLSEIMQPWFYFSFMEAKNLTKTEREKTVAGDIQSDKMFMEILHEGEAEGVFAHHDAQMVANAIKAMLQDWYLKRKKYAKQNVHVDQYAEFLLGFVEGYLCNSRRSEVGNSKLETGNWKLATCDLLTPET
jgi:AcrR family transcriptional regulator